MGTYLNIDEDAVDWHALSSFRQHIQDVYENSGYPMWAALEICRQFLVPSVAPGPPRLRHLLGWRGLSGLRTTSGARQMTIRSARSLFPPSLRGLRGRGGERPFSNFESARSAGNWRERGSEMNPGDFRCSKRDQIRGTPRKSRIFLKLCLLRGSRLVE